MSTPTPPALAARLRVLVTTRLPTRGLRTPGSAGSTRRPRGFTLVELLVAVLIASIALLGVYATLLATIEVEFRTTARWERRASARTAVDHLAASVGGALNVAGMPGIAGGPDPQGGYVLECVTQESGGAGHGLLLRRRYRWDVPSELAFAENSNRVDPSPAGPAGGSGTLQVQTLVYAGTKDLTPYAAEAEPQGEDPWALVPPRILASGLSEIRVTFRQANDPDGPWEDQYSGNAGAVMVRFTVSSGGETTERIVLPRARAQLGQRAE